MMKSHKNRFVPIPVENQSGHQEQQCQRSRGKIAMIAILGLVLILTINYLFQAPSKEIQQIQEIKENQEVQEKPNQAYLTMQENQEPNHDQSQDPSVFQNKRKQEEQRFQSVSFPKQGDNLNRLQAFQNSVRKSRALWLGMEEPKNYRVDNREKELTQNIEQLPMCIYSHRVENRGHLEEIQASLQKQYQMQKYKNFIHVFSTEPLIQQSESPKTPFPSHYVKLDSYHPDNYLIKNAIISGCPQKSIVVMANNPLRRGALSDISLLYNLENIWLTYYLQRKQQKQNTHPQYRQLQLNSVSSFYTQVIRNIPDGLLISQNSLEIVSLASTLLKLTKYHAESVPNYYLYEGSHYCSSLDCFKNVRIEKAQSYTQNPMMYLQPNRDSQKDVNFYLYKITSGKAKQPKYNQRNNLTLSQMLRAIEYFSLKKVPDNHFLARRQYFDLQNKYNLSKYSSKELPLCVIIPSFNNIDDDRYRKVLDTIKMQNYSNYHIVFIDDASTDETYDKTQQYLRKIGLFNRTRMIKNQEKMFATYNIQNAIHNFCESKQIVALVDGDDELIGKQVFRIVNAAYQKKDNWLVYMNYMSNIYMYGVSKVLTQEMFDEKDPVRKNVHIVAPLRTFYADLYRKIELKDHKDSTGAFLDSLYDDAMQFPMMEMCGMQHMEYIPEIVYFYNQNYGNNDASTPESQKRRQSLKADILQRPKYKRIKTLF